MKLLIDFGNSRCKWATIENGKWLSGGAIAFDDENSQDSIDTLLSTLPVERCTGVHAVSVLGAAFEDQFTQHLRAHTGIEPVFYWAQREGFGLQLGYADPLNYGADRYAALVAAQQTQGGAKLVVDCGTAVTLDAIDSLGNHMGGLIIPGIELMKSMLATKASGIATAEGRPPVEYFNHNTLSAVHSGSTLCLRYGLRSIMETMISMIGEECSVFVTGGDRATLLDLSNQQYIVRPQLVLEGLEIMQRA